MSVDDLAAQQAAARSVPAPESALALASEILGIPVDPVVRVWRHTAHADAPITVQLQSGRKLHWERQRELLVADTLVIPVVLAAGLTAPRAPLKKGQAIACAKALANAAVTFEEFDDLGEMAELIDGFLRDRDVWEAHMAEQDAWRGALLRLHGFKASLRPSPGDDTGMVPDWQTAPVLLDVDSGTRYVRTIDVADYIRKGRKLAISWPALNARLEAVGWPRREWRIWTPLGAPRERQQQTKVRVYVGERDDGQES